MSVLVTALAMLASVQTAQVKSEDDLVYHWSRVFEEFDDTLSNREADVLAVLFVAKTRQWRNEVVQWNENKIKELADENRRERDPIRRRNYRSEIRRLGIETRKLKKAKPGQWPMAKIRRCEPDKMGVLDLSCEVLQIVDGHNALISVNRGGELLWVTNITTKGMVDDQNYDFDYIFHILEETKTFRTLLGGSKTVRVAQAVADYQRPRP